MLICVATWWHSNGCEGGIFLYNGEDTPVEAFTGVARLFDWDYEDDEDMTITSADHIRPTPEAVEALKSMGVPVLESIDAAV
jgi:hypothetical protein